MSYTRHIIQTRHRVRALPLSAAFLTPCAAGLISCGLRALPTKTLLLPDYKLGTNSLKFGNILYAGCLLGDFFFFLALLLFWIFGVTSAKFFQANSETRHGKLEWFVHVKSFWSLLELLKRFCDLDHKLARCQGKIFVFSSLQKTPKHD